LCRLIFSVGPSAHPDYDVELPTYDEACADVPLDTVYVPSAYYYVPPPLNFVVPSPSIVTDPEMNQHTYSWTPQQIQEPQNSTPVTAPPRHTIYTPRWMCAIAPAPGETTEQQSNRVRITWHEYKII